MRFVSTGISISSINRIKELAEEKRYAEALEILDTQNLDKSINPQFLRISGEIFRENKRYYDSRKILLKSHQMSPQGLRIIYELIRLYLELGYFTKAKQYYEQYIFYSTPDDIQKDYVEYDMKKATGADTKELAAILIPILERMPEDKWNFEAILLYDKMGRKDKALEESKYILENFKDSVYVNLVIQYIDDKLNVDEYFNVYPHAEVTEDEELFGDLIALEEKILEEDHLRMYPPEAKIVIEAEDKEGIEAKPLKDKKEKKEKKTKKRKAKDNVESIDSEERITGNESLDSKEQESKVDQQQHFEELTAEEASGEEQIDNISETKQNEILEENIKKEREAALDKILSKKINTEQIKESAKQVAKAVKEIDTEKTKHQMKNVAESVKGNVKKATDAIGEAVGAMAVDNISKDVKDGEKASAEEQIVDGIIESILEPPKKSVGQVVTNEELDALIPDSLEAMSAEEIADLEARKEEEERLELEALEASLQLEEEKKKARRKSSDDVEESLEDETQVVDKAESAQLESLQEDKEEIDIPKLQQLSSEKGDFLQLKEQFLNGMKEDEPLDSLGFITIVQSDVSDDIENELPDAAQMLHQMISNREFYTGEDSTKFESKASYDKQDFEVEDFEFETYRDGEESILADAETEQSNISEELSVEMIYAQKSVLDFDEMIPEEQKHNVSEEIPIQEKVESLEEIIPDKVERIETETVSEERESYKEETVSEETESFMTETVSEETESFMTETVSEEAESYKEGIVSKEIASSKEEIILKETKIFEETSVHEEIESMEETKELLEDETIISKEEILSSTMLDEIDSDNTDIENIYSNRERLRIRILISDNMVRKLTDLKESR